MANQFWKPTLLQGRRAIKSIKQFEADPRNTLEDAQSNKAIYSNIWIQITSSTSSGGVWYYSWKKVMRVGNTVGFFVDDPAALVSNSLSLARDVQTTVAAVATGRKFLAIVNIGQDGVATYTFDSGATASSTTSPVTIGSTSEGSETADTATWTRGTDPIIVYQVSRVVYNHAGDKALYAYVRAYTYDTLGALYSVSAETRYTVDAAGSCT